MNIMKATTVTQVEQANERSGRTDDGVIKRLLKYVLSKRSMEKIKQQQNLGLS